MSSGRLCVLEGLDGSGKTTQWRAVQGALSARGIAFTPITFPSYGDPSAVLVEMYLRGEFGAHAMEVSAYGASCFYAADRYAQYLKSWGKDYRDGKLILAARYTTSNAIHQMAKLPRDQWDGFLAWLYDFEYVRLGLPRPDEVIYLSASPEFLARQIAHRGSEANKPEGDIHETDDQYLRACRAAAEYAARQGAWDKLCVENEGEFLPPGQITRMILERVLRGIE